jgi:hypothetical protein
MLRGRVHEKKSKRTIWIRIKESGVLKSGAVISTEEFGRNIMLRDKEPWDLFSVLHTGPHHSLHNN